MERSRSSHGFAKVSSTKWNTEPGIRPGSLRSDELTIDVGILAPGSGASNWHGQISDDEAHGMLELNFDVNPDRVTLRSVIPGEEQMWEHRHSRNAISTILAGSNASIHSPSFRESITSVRNMVKQFSNEIMRNSRNASSRVHKVEAETALVMDPELGNCSTDPSMQKSASRAEYAIHGLRVINKATATADQTKSWGQVEARFLTLATPDGMLPRSNFAECVGMKDSKEFANSLYDAAVRQKRGDQKVDSISKEEFYEYWLHITDKSFDGRMRMFFQLCDTDLDGRITCDEVKQVIMLSASANKLSKLKEQAGEYAALIMEELDVNRTGYIELSQLETLMRGSVQGCGTDAVVQYSSMLTPKSKRSRIQRVAEKSWFFALDNWKRLWILALWLATMAALFTWKFLQYRHRSAFHVMGYALCFAKGAAETLKLNMALILLPVCRNTLTRLRSTRLGKIIPFDDNLEFHKIIAGSIAVASFVHGTCHIAGDIPHFVNAPHEKFEKYFGEEFDHQPSYGEILLLPVGLTAIAIVVLMTIAFLLASHWFRRSLIKLPWPLHRLHGFNVFWYSHHLFVLVYILLLVHSLMLLLHNPWYERTTWMYIAVPVLFYFSERLLRVFRTKTMQVDVVKAAIYTGNVLAIHITKPAGFKYKSGMYLFLQCPKISSFEWHPFSITSAPDDPFLSVHIRTLGDWTSEMKKIFAEACGGRKSLQTVNNYDLSGELTLAARFPKLYIDGPYGAPAQDYLKYDVLLLVGLGIGATPMISILKDMVHHDASDPSATPDLRPADARKKKGGRKPKAYFYWVTREQGSFDWFRGVMHDVEEIDNKESIEMHNYLTSVYEEGDARSTLVMMLQALHHAKNGVDLVSGTRARTHFARPNWKSVFSNLAATHQDKRVGVFYCGPVALAKELETLSRTYTMKSSTKFSFHKENF